MVHVPPFARKLAKRYLEQIKRLEGAIPDWVPRMAHKFGPRWRSRALVRAQHAMLFQQYGGPTDPDEVLQDWANWLRKEGGQRLEAMLHVEPTVNAASECGFRLIRRDMAASGPLDFAAAAPTTVSSLATPTRAQAPSEIEP